MLEDVNEIFMAILPDRKSETLLMKTAKHPYAAAMECFSNAIGKVDVEHWDEVTELITIYKVYSMKSNLFGFSPELIGLDNYGNPKIPMGTNYQKLGAALVSLSSPEEQGQPFGFNIEFLPIAQTINDITTN